MKQRKLDSLRYDWRNFSLFWMCLALKPELLLQEV